jgi:hypothetical protein
MVGAGDIAGVSAELVFILNTINTPIVSAVI